MLSTQLEHSRLSPSLPNVSIRESNELNEFIIGDVVSWALQLIFPFSHTNPGLLDLCFTAFSLTETPQISLSSAVALLIWGCLGTEMYYQNLKKKSLLNVRVYAKLWHEKKKKGEHF